MGKQKQQQKKQTFTHLGKTHPFSFPRLDSPPALQTPLPSTHKNTDHMPNAFLTEYYSTGNFILCLNNSYLCQLRIYAFPFTLSWRGEGVNNIKQTISQKIQSWGKKVLYNLIMPGKDMPGRCLMASSILSFFLWTDFSYKFKKLPSHYSIIK